MGHRLESVRHWNVFAAMAGVSEGPASLIANEQRVNLMDGG